MNNATIDISNSIHNSNYSSETPLDHSLHNQPANDNTFHLIQFQPNYTSPPKKARKKSRQVSENDVRDNDRNNLDDPKIKRKIQNREAQRASRKRKDDHMADLQKRLQTFEDSKAESIAQVQKENAKLRQMVNQLRVKKNALENKFSSLFGSNSLKGLMKKRTPPSTPPATFDPSPIRPSPSGSALTDQEDESLDLLEYQPRHKESDIKPSEPIAPPPTELLQAWDKLSEHPRFDDIDLGFLCTEMKKKALVTDHHEKLNALVDLHYPV
ncbi:hypothetical protein CLU79DRAFT_751419 [Phycomyces nitens]|nr:hypothetical protein CLU79DRAFT_751419 [Phycomyces nitens]